MSTINYALIIHLNQLSSTDYSRDRLRELHDSCKAITKSTFDGRVMIDYNGFLFRISFYRSELTSSITVWDVRGTHTLFSDFYTPSKNGGIPDDIYNRLYDILRDYTMGICVCHNCKERKPFTLGKGYFPFSGWACTDCWKIESFRKFVDSIKTD